MTGQAGKDPGAAGLVEDTASRLERTGGLLIEHRALAHMRRSVLDDAGARGIARGHTDARPRPMPGARRPARMARGLSEGGTGGAAADAALDVLPMPEGAAATGPSVETGGTVRALEREGALPSADAASGIPGGKRPCFRGALSRLGPKDVAFTLTGKAPALRTAEAVNAGRAFSQRASAWRSGLSIAKTKPGFAPFQGPSPLSRAAQTTGRRLLLGRRKLAVAAARSAAALKASAGIATASVFLAFSLTAFSLTAFAGIASTGEADRVPAGPAEMVAAYLDEALSMAANDSIGYSMVHRCLDPDVDCSSFVYYSLLHAGYTEDELGGSWPFTTATMDPILTALGFERRPFTTVADLAPGDILWRSSHTEIHIGGGRNVGAHSNYDGRGGDGSGREVCTGTCSGNWEFYYRLAETKPQGDADKEDPNGQT